VIARQSTRASTWSSSSTTQGVMARANWMIDLGPGAAKAASWVTSAASHAMKSPMILVHRPLRAASSTAASPSSAAVTSRAKPGKYPSGGARNRPAVTTRGHPGSSASNLEASSGEPGSRIASTPTASSADALAGHESQAHDHLPGSPDSGDCGRRRDQAAPTRQHLVPAMPSGLRRRPYRQRSPAREPGRPPPSCRARTTIGSSHLLCVSQDLPAERVTVRVTAGPAARQRHLLR